MCVFVEKLLLIVLSGAPWLDDFVIGYVTFFGVLPERLLLPDWDFLRLAGDFLVLMRLTDDFLFLVRLTDDFLLLVCLTGGFLQLVGTDAPRWATLEMENRCAPMGGFVGKNENRCAPMGGFVGKSGCALDGRLSMYWTGASGIRLEPARARAHNLLLIDNEAQYAAANCGGILYLPNR